MGKFEHRDNSFTAFKNNRKEAATHADFTGEGLIEGKKVWINIWVKKDKNGNPYYSGSVRAQGEKSKSFTAKDHNQPLEDDESIPF